MERIENLRFNYYLNTVSYVKTIMDALPEGVASKGEKSAVIDIFNAYYVCLDEAQRKVFADISNSFNNKVSGSNISLLAEYMYCNFIYSIIYDFRTQKKTILELHNSIKKYLSPKEYSLNAISEEEKMRRPYK